MKRKYFWFICMSIFLFLGLNHLAFGKPLSQRLDVSFGDANEWIENLDSQEVEEQIRDWATFGLAGLLNIDIETLRNFSYDKTPLRDSLFADITTNRVGPGRSLPDGKGTLHLLVPKNDPYAARTIGMLLDDYRKDSGNDPKNVRVYRYKIDLKEQNVVLEPSGLESSEEVRKIYGYHRMPVDTQDGLMKFLKKARHLSRLEIHQGKIWAEGWDWPAVPSGAITLDDISVLYEGYLLAALGIGREPGFSLDPGPLMEQEEILDLLKESSFPKVEEAFEAADNFQLIRFLGILGSNSEEETETLFNETLILENELIRKYGDIFQTVSKIDDPPYQLARYEGGLQGTEIGMTYFYTDIVAKAWPMGKGTGIPTGKVPGFVSDIQAKTPWGHCGSGSEQGRLWFGLREEAVSIHENHIDFGSPVARLFSKVNDQLREDQETEPSYRFGRIMRWWDRNYIPMADYEPQYHRLDQLMRWGAALAWLINNEDLILPEFSLPTKQENLHFAEWMSSHSELKWKYDISFVTPAEVKTEALLTIYSEYFEDCGSTGLRWSGGISSPGLKKITTIKDRTPNLGPEVNRGGTTKLGTNFSVKTQTGTIQNGPASRTLYEIAGDTTKIGIVGEERKVWSFSGLKGWIKEDAPRIISLDLSARKGFISQEMSLQGHKIGKLFINNEATIASVHWKPGILARTSQALTSIQKSLGKGKTLSESSTSSHGASLVYTDHANSREFLRLDTPGSQRWVSIEEKLVPAEEHLAFRLGAPGKPLQDPTWYTANFTESPSLSSTSGQSVKWLAVEIKDGVKPARIIDSIPPTSETSKLNAHYAHANHKGVLAFHKKDILTSADDPIFGFNGTPEGVTFFKPGILEKITKAQRDAQTANDGYARAVTLSEENVALVKPEGLTIVPLNDKWNSRVLEAIKGDGSKKYPLVKIDNDQPFIVSKIDSPKFGETIGPIDLAEIIIPQRKTFGNKPRGPPIYLNTKLSDGIILEEGAILAEGVGRGRQVRIKTLVIPKNRFDEINGTDIIASNKTEWRSLSRPLLDVSVNDEKQEDGTIWLIYSDDDCREKQLPSYCETNSL